MTFDEFIAKYNGKPVDFDGYYGVQCMDLMHQYHYDVLGLKDARTLAAPYARNVYENFDTIFGREHFEKIPNTPTGVPQKGDIILWNKTVGEAGHVAVFIDGDANTFRSFDANWPVGTNCHIQTHNYNGVYGWLRFKKQAAPAPDGILLTDTYEKNGYNNLVNYRKSFPAGANGQEGNFEGFVARLISRDGLLPNLENDLANANRQITELEASILDQSEHVSKVEGENKSLQNRLEISEKTSIDKDGIIRDRDEEIERLSRELTECQAQQEPVVIQDPLRQQIKDILYNKGFFWTKYWRIKELVPNS